MPIIKKIKLFFIASFFGGCLYDSDSNKIIGDYETSWINIPKTRGINKGETLLLPYVSEIGHNSDYIIAKQHPIKQGNKVSVYFDITNYYIIQVTSNSFQDKPVYGPLNKMSFDSLRNRLQITNIKFDISYKKD